MTTDKTTVMGPGAVDNPASILTPPSYSEGTDRLAWREAVTDWCNNVLACASGGDNRAKGIAACLALTLYRSLPSGTKEQVKQSVRSGEIILTTGEGLGTETQSGIVKKILDIVAKDTAVDRISRMVRLNTQVHKCARKNGESIRDFIARFKVPAFAYLNIIRTDYNSAESQIFAMTLIINAKLGEQSFANIISTLINKTKCSTHERESHIGIRKERLEKITNALEARESIENEDVKECIRVMKAAVSAHDNSSDERDNARTFISLESAFEALESLSLEQKSLEDTAERTVTIPTTTNALMGRSENREYDGKFRNSQRRGWNDRHRFGLNPNRGRYQAQKPWRNQEDWRQDSQDLRKELEKKRTTRAPTPDMKNDEKFRKRIRFGDTRNDADGGQDFH